jgi:hypothetical protein
MPLPSRSSSCAASIEVSRIESSRPRGHQTGVSNVVGGVTGGERVEWKAQEGRSSMNPYGSRRFGPALALGSTCVIALVAACTLWGPTSEATASRSAGAVTRATALCDSSGSLTHLVVRRVDAFPQNHIRFSFPATVVVRETAAVRRVARALCALPAMPNQGLHCPMDLGITSHLEFSSPTQHFRVVTVDATGCQSVTGLAPQRWIARSPGFWRTLGSAMHLKTPSWETFRGGRPGS